MTMRMMVLVAAAALALYLPHFSGALRRIEEETSKPEIGDAIEKVGSSASLEEEETGAPEIGAAIAIEEARSLASLEDASSGGFPTADEIDVASLVGNTVFASFADILSQEFCWRKGYTRKAGRLQKCPEEDGGVACGLMQNSCKYPYGRRRNTGYGRCRLINKGRSGCPDAFPDLKAGLCYEEPRPAFECRLIDCRQVCPAWLTECGRGACSANKWSCVGKAVSMTWEIAKACASTAALVASFGTSGGLTVVKPDSATMQAFGMAAQANLKNVRAKLANGAIKKAIEDLAMKKLESMYDPKVWREKLESFAKDEVVACVGAMENEFTKKASGVGGEWDWRKLDTTGISAAVKTTRSKESSRVDKVKAWTTVVGQFDPTGWISAAAAFMEPVCES